MRRIPAHSPPPYMAADAPVFSCLPNVCAPKGSRKQSESPLVAPRLSIQSQRIESKGQPCRGETPAAKKKSLKNVSIFKNPFLPSFPNVWGRRFPKGDRKALWSRPQARNPCRKKEKFEERLHWQQGSQTCERFRPPAGVRGTFHHWKVPKGCRGRRKGACLIAAPGPLRC